MNEHRPVLLNEVLEGLAIKADGIYIDATFGRGGHSRAILAQLGPKGRLLAIDKDPQAVASGQQLAGLDPRFSMHQGSFANLKMLAQEAGIVGQVDGLLMDLGVSSPQLDDPLRGFSFLRDGPLDMRMDTSSGVDAATWLHKVKESELVTVLKEYGEERFAKRIANAIVTARQQEAITRTGQLAAIVKAANPKWEIGKHPATRSFQAIRIFINSELLELQSCLGQALDVLAIGGHLAVISFHSLEDRIVKRFIREQAQGSAELKRFAIPDSQLAIRLRALSRAVLPSSEEVDQNPRARSAVLRIAEKLT